jgi:hypothetical protein
MIEKKSYNTFTALSKSPAHSMLWQTLLIPLRGNNDHTQPGELMKALALITLMSLTSTAWSADPSTDEREKMAAAHTQMATCLRTTQDLKTCHDEMMKECKSMMGGSCASMDMGQGMHKGMKYKK